MERDQWSCQACKSKTKNLQVHHLYYCKLDPWEYPDTVYQTLCDECHELRGELTNKASNALRMAIKGVSTENLEACARYLMDVALKSTPDRANLTTQLHVASDFSEAEQGALPHGLWSDLLHSLMSCQRDPESKDSNGWGAAYLSCSL